MENSTLKFIFYIFNLILFLIGASLVTIGTCFLTLFAHDFNFAQFSVQAASIAFVVIGSALILFAILGVLVTRTDQKFLVLVHIVGLILAFIALTILGIWGLVNTYNGNLNDTTKKEILDSMNKYNDTLSDSIDNREIDWLQTKFKCCGFNSSGDWRKFNFSSMTSNHEDLADEMIEDLQSRNQSLFDVPDSCCVKESKGCGLQYPKLELINRKGCFDPFFDFLSKDMKIICYIAIALAILSLISILFLVFVCYSIGGEYTQLSTE